MPEANVPHWNVDRSFVLRVSVIAALGGVLYGYDMGIIAAALLYVRNTFHLTAGMEEAVVSVVLLGAMLGALLGGTVADRIGRKKTLVLAALIFVCGSVLAPLSPNVGVLILARAILGFAIGFTSVTAPVYVSELAPPQSRGRLIGLYQLALTFGIATADLVGYFLAGQKSWRLMFGIGAAPAILFSHADAERSRECTLARVEAALSGGSNRHPQLRARTRGNMAPARDSTESGCQARSEVGFAVESQHP